MKTYKTTYVTKIKAKNFQDALNISVTNAPRICESSKTEEFRETKQDKVSDLFHELGEMFNPKK